MTQTIPHAPLRDDIAAILDNQMRRHASLIVCRDAIINAYRAITATFEQGGILYIAGNGGSFADAIHIKGEIGKSFSTPQAISDNDVLAELNKSEIGKVLAKVLEQGFPVVVLGESLALQSAYNNDVSGEYILAQELNSFAPNIRSGVFLGISTSGNAKNVNAAMILANAYDLTTISLTGALGGDLASKADIAIRAPEDITYKIQELHLPIYHALCLMIECYFCNE